MTKKQITAAELAALQNSLAEKRLQAQISRLKGEKEALQHALEQEQLRFNALIELDAARRPLEPWEPRAGHVLSTDRRVACAFAALSDVHPEEQVDRRKVDGLNHFTPAIASFRLQRHREGIEWLIREQRSMFDIHDLYLWLGGDLITGYIHDELVESNYLSPVETSQFMLRETSETVRYLRRAFPELRIHVKANRGNHGRTTAKIRISTGAENSYEWMMYCILAREFADDPMVDFEVARGELLYTEIYGLTLRLTHGDSTRFSGGVHGLSIPLGKACMKWNQTRHAHLTVFGHYHTYQPGEQLTVNGSVIGYNPFAVHIQAAFEPPAQAFFLIDRKRGRTQAAPLWVGDYSTESQISDTLPRWWTDDPFLGGKGAA